MPAVGEGCWCAAMAASSCSQSTCNAMPALLKLVGDGMAGGERKSRQAAAAMLPRLAVCVSHGRSVDGLDGFTYRRPWVRVVSQACCGSESERGEAGAEKGSSAQRNTDSVDPSSNNSVGGMQQSLKPAATACGRGRERTRPGEEGTESEEAARRATQEGAGRSNALSLKMPPVEKP